MGHNLTSSPHDTTSCHSFFCALYSYQVGPGSCCFPFASFTIPTARAGSFRSKWHSPAQEHHLDIVFVCCLLRVSRQTGREPRPMHSDPQGKSALCTQKVDWTSDESLILSFLLGTLCGSEFAHRTVQQQPMCLRSGTYRQQHSDLKFHSSRCQYEPLSSHMFQARKQ